MVAVAYGQLVYLLLHPDFTPTQQMKEDSMPYLLPFILLFFYLKPNATVRWPGIFATTLAILFYAFLSEGRAAQLSAVFAIFLFFIFALNIRWYIACLISALSLLIIILGNQDTFIQLSGHEQSFYEVLNRFTSNRWELWDHAITSAPGWNILGYGMGNIRYADEIVTFSSGLKVAHLHNFILDLWFETGWIGLIAFLCFVTSIIHAVSSSFVVMSSKKKIISGAALSSTGAILMAGLFSFSYNSKQFGVYLMLCLALLLWSARSTSEREPRVG
jgi:O-antigen ligase